MSPSPRSFSSSVVGGCAPQNCGGKRVGRNHARLRNFVAAELGANSHSLNPGRPDWLIIPPRWPFPPRNWKPKGQTKASLATDTDPFSGGEKWDSQRISAEIAEKAIPPRLYRGGGKSSMQHSCTPKPRLRWNWRRAIYRHGALLRSFASWATLGKLADRWQAI